MKICHYFVIELRSVHFCPQFRFAPNHAGYMYIYYMYGSKHVIGLKWYAVNRDFPKTVNYLFVGCVYMSAL